MAEMSKHEKAAVHSMHHKVKAEHHRRMAKEHERMAIHHDKMEDHFAGQAHDDEAAEGESNVHVGRSRY